MHGDFGLLTNLSVSLVLALALGLITHRVRLSPIVGYLLAGVAIGPQTPGFVADAKMAGAFGEHAEQGQNIFLVLGFAVVKVAALGLVVVVGGRLVISWLLRQVARTRSREMFTLTVLALALAVATGSSVIFGVSMALGAFLADMVVGQTEVSHQAAADASPMRDAFGPRFAGFSRNLADTRSSKSRGIRKHPGVLRLA
jgi:predicted Kef-type K+ transport protein